MEKKITKRQYFEALRTVVETMDVVGEYPTDDVLAFIDAQVAQLDAKAEKAKARAAKKSAEGDETEKRVMEVLTTELQTADDIVAILNDEDLTKSKVIARLSKLIKKGLITKEQIKIEDSNVKRMAYKLI